MTAPPVPEHDAQPAANLVEHTMTFDDTAPSGPPSEGVLAIDEQEVEGVRTLTVRGELDLATGPQLLAHVNAKAPGVTVVLDLTEVQFIDSTGLRSLLSAKAEVERQGGQFRIEGMSPAARRLLEVTGTLEHLKAQRNRTPDDPLSA